jgi:hypothetical protein
MEFNKSFDTGLAVVVVIIGVLVWPTPEPKATASGNMSAWIQDGGTVPLTSSGPDDLDDLQAYLSKEGVYSLLLFKEDGRFRWVDRSGKEIPICGTTVEGQITGGCGIEGKKVELTTFTDFTVIGT